MRQPFAVLGRFQGVVDDDFAGRFDELYGVAYRAAYGILGNRAEAEDCSQEALARALVRWRRMHDYAPAWVARVSVNLALDRTRSARRADRLAPLAANRQARTPRMPSRSAKWPGLAESVFMHPAPDPSGLALEPSMSSSQGG